MKLLVDIGNTNTSIAVEKNGRLIKRYFIHTAKKEISSIAFRRLLKRYIPELKKVIIVSVVPEFLVLLERTLASVAPSRPRLVVGRDVLAPIKNNYERPNDVGQDRLVAAFAAKLRYEPPLVIVDFGTAVTMDLVNRKGEYEGGLIFPGIRLAIASLFKSTALLPKIALKAPSGFVGRTTRDSMNNGLVFGYAAFCDGLIERFRSEYPGKLTVVATGGDAKLIAEYSRLLKIVSPDLIFGGLSKLSNPRP